MKKILNLFLVAAIIFSLINFAQAKENLSDNYQLEKIFIFSRHNVRAPTATSSKTLNQITNFNWQWTSGPGQLSSRGGVLETEMGQFFRKYLENENFITDNYIPAENEFKFYANSRQRTMATAQYFSSGFLPVANVKIEHKYKIEGRDEIFENNFSDFDGNFRETVIAETFSQNNVKSLNELVEKFQPSMNLIEKTVDFKNSSYAKENNLQHFPTNDFEVVEKGKNSVSWTGGIQKATSVSDALLMQFYENPGKINEKQLEKIMKIHDLETDAIFGNPIAAGVAAKPLLKFIDEELLNDRKFTFICGHDVNIRAILSALEVENYSLPNTLEKKSPIGVKFVVEKRIGADGTEYANIFLAYQTLKQIKNYEILSLENPPQIFKLKFKKLQANENGLYLYADFEKLVSDTIARN